MFGNSIRTGLLAGLFRCCRGERTGRLGHPAAQGRAGRRSSNGPPTWSSRRTAIARPSTARARSFTTGFRPSTCSTQRNPDPQSSGGGVPLLVKWSGRATTTYKWAVGTQFRDSIDIEEGLGIVRQRRRIPPADRLDQDLHRPSPRAAVHEEEMPARRCWKRQPPTMSRRRPKPQ